MAKIKYGHRPLTKSECKKVAQARKRIDQMFSDLDGLPVEPVKERTIGADLQAIDHRLYEVERQLCNVTGGSLGRARRRRRRR